MSATSDDRALTPKEHFALYREFITHEDLLMNNRLSWSLVIQGFLFAAYAGALQKLVDIQTKCQANASTPARIQLHTLLVLLPLLGLFVSFFVLMGVNAARVAIETLYKRWKQEVVHDYKRSGPHYGLPELIGGGSTFAHKTGLWATFSIPLVFGVIWLALLLPRVGAWIASLFPRLLVLW